MTVVDADVLYAEITSDVASRSSPRQYVAHESAAGDEVQFASKIAESQVRDALPCPALGLVA